jgi:hypothetical protein
VGVARGDLSQAQAQVLEGVLPPVKQMGWWPRDRRQMITGIGPRHGAAARTSLAAADYEASPRATGPLSTAARIGDGLNPLMMR